jgi:ribosomal protein S21
MKIFVRNNDITKALRILKKKMLEEGDTKEFRARQFFVSKGEEKRIAVKAGKKRWAKKQILIEKAYLPKLKIISWLSSLQT